MQVFQVYSSAMRQILKHVGVPDRRPGGDFSAVPVAPQRYHSDKPWRLPEPRGFRKSAAFLFVDDVSDEPSGLVYSSRVGRASLLAAASADATGYLPIGANGSGTLTASFVFASDPELSVEVLPGQSLVAHMLTNLVDDIGRRDDPEPSDVAARIEFSLTDLRRSLLDAYTPPFDWSGSLSHMSIVGDEGETADIRLDLAVPSPGTGYFAVAFVDSASDEGETTDAWVIHVDVDLNVWAMPDPSDIALPELVGV